MNNSLAWRCVDLLSKALDPAERDAVRGDLAESGATAGAALRDISGLVARRLATRLDWRLCLAVGVPFVAARSLRGELTDFSLAFGQQWLMFSHYGVAYPTGPTFSEDVSHLATLSLALVFWSWVCGIALGSLSGRNIWVTASLLCLEVLGGASRPYELGVVLFLPALLWGIRRGLNPRPSELRTASILAVSGVGATVLVLWGNARYEATLWLWRGGLLHRHSWQREVAPLAILNWPIAYLMGLALWRRYKNLEVSQFENQSRPDAD